MMHKRAAMEATTTGERKGRWGEGEQEKCGLVSPVPPDLGLCPQSRSYEWTLPNILRLISIQHP